MEKLVVASKVFGLELQVLSKAEAARCLHHGFPWDLPWYHDDATAATTALLPSLAASGERAAAEITAEAARLEALSAHFNQQVAKKLEVLNANKQRRMEQILRVREREEEALLREEELLRLAKMEKMEELQPAPPKLLGRTRRLNVLDKASVAAEKEKAWRLLHAKKAPLEEVAEKIQWITETEQRQAEARTPATRRQRAPLAAARDGDPPARRGDRPGAPDKGDAAPSSPNCLGKKTIEEALIEAEAAAAAPPPPAVQKTPALRTGGLTAALRPAAKEAAPAAPPAAPPPPLTAPHRYIAADRFAYMLKTSEVILFDTSPAALAVFGEGLYSGCQIEYESWEAQGARATILGVHGGALWRYDHNTAKPTAGERSGPDPPAAAFEQVANRNDLSMRYPMSVVGKRERAAPPRTADPFWYALWTCQTVLFDISMEACGEYGVAHGERYLCGKRPPHAKVASEQDPTLDDVLIVIIGVYKDKLYYSYLDSTGALPYDYPEDIVARYDLRFMYTAPVGELVMDALPASAALGIGGVTNSMTCPTRRLYSCSWANLLFNVLPEGFRRLGFDRLAAGLRIQTPSGRVGVVAGVARCCPWVHWEGDRGASLCEGWDELRAAVVLEHVDAKPVRKLRSRMPEV
eukprot:TRINITY_DN16212_c0_g1_i1.p1 TRINITY_DN16212_c0_g1~~TRINITY_DN16212_c0_g1_i1.p1  ORF type:complete len:721 (+),score=309.58 TRINITY_DN16212_c0_g1_i1:257-2164(+)